MKSKLWLVIFWLLPLLAFGGAGTPGVTLMVRTNGAVLAPTNFFAANSNAINAVVPPGTIQTNIGYVAVTNAPWQWGNGALSNLASADLDISPYTIKAGSGDLYLQAEQDNDQIVFTGELAGNAAGLTNLPLAGVSGLTNALDWLTNNAGGLLPENVVTNPYHSVLAVAGLSSTGEITAATMGLDELYVTNFYTQITNAPALQTDADGKLTAGGGITYNLAQSTNLPLTGLRTNGAVAGQVVKFNGTNWSAEDAGGVLASGTAALANGNHVVESTSANATNSFLIGYRSVDGTLSTVGIKDVVEGTSFTIFSGNASDTNQVDWAIVTAGAGGGGSTTTFTNIEPEQMAHGVYVTYREIETSSWLPSIPQNYSSGDILRYVDCDLVECLVSMNPLGTMANCYYLSFPKLQFVDNLELNPDTTDVDVRFPSLRSVEGSLSQGSLSLAGPAYMVTNYNFNALENVFGDFLFNGNGFKASKLPPFGVRFPALTNVGAQLNVGEDVVFTGDDTGFSVNFSNLANASVVELHGVITNANFDSLAACGYIDYREDTTNVARRLYFPSLKSFPTNGVSLPLFPEGMFASIELDGLEHDDSQGLYNYWGGFLNNHSYIITNISLNGLGDNFNATIFSAGLPSLQSVSFNSLRLLANASLELIGSTNLTQMSFPLLEEVTQNVQIETVSGSLRVLELPSLKYIGSLQIDYSDGEGYSFLAPSLESVADGFLYLRGQLTNYNFNSLTNVNTIYFYDTTNIHRIYFPSLQSFPAGGFQFLNEDNEITSIELDGLEHDDQGGLANYWPLISSHAYTITNISMNSLTNDFGAALNFLGELPLLRTLSFNSLVTCQATVNIIGSTNVTQLTFPALVDSQHHFNCYDNPNLVGVSAPNWLPYDGFSLTFTGNALDETSVNHILARCVAAGLTAATIDLSGGSNAAPTGQGLTDKATLISNGCTVTTN